MLKKGIAVVIMGLLWLPLAALMLGVKSAELGGAEQPVALGTPRLERLASGAWQAEFAEWFAWEFPFRAWLIRGYNQAVYWAFDKSTNYVLLGEDGQLFAFNHYEAYAGLSAPKEPFWRAQADSIDQLASVLRQSGVPLLVVVAPNKVRTMPEKLPVELRRAPRSVSVYERFTSTSRQTPVLDLMHEMLRQKAEGGPPVFANTGIHWNQFGLLQCMPAVDSALAHLLQRPSQGLYLANGRWLDGVQLDDDYDLARRLDVLAMPEMQRQWYPELHAARPWGDDKPRVLLIADSFAYTMIKTGALDVLSNGWELWFYGASSVTKEHAKRPLRAGEAAVRWSEFDAVILMATEYNLPDLPFGFRPQ